MDELTDFFTVEEGRRLFRFGQSDSAAAKACASACGRFAWDDDEECVDDVCTPKGNGDTGTKCGNVVCNADEVCGETLTVCEITRI